ncbi:hypothetical protein BMS3Bbin12_00507 [bacterium BMS3Bbin12]|nr:hypothetical protein BMS3Abin12_00605 [bacterium BMS3Abin12]GBE47348.1 hypothetical protein BMS3Bbin12_00507 [bacterium BMS3Bbin12]GBE50346.1 hypothetical protein BMS3Bbin13_01285 [bacterium BMS3Bbin13]HDJ86359.1 type II secretion protein [Chromatiales bacterium]
MTTESTPYVSLVEDGVLTMEQLAAAQESAAARGVELERVLLKDVGVSRCALLTALSRHFGCRFIQYDERVPVPSRLFAGLDGDVLQAGKWFPVMMLGETAVIAAADPHSETMKADVMRRVPAAQYEFRVALAEDVRRYIQDYLHAEAKLLIGIERTGLAHWRNNMALWRTRLACHRTEHARARTAMKLLRWGLAMVALSNALTRIQAHGLKPYHAAILAAGIGLAAAGLYDYLKIRRRQMSAPWRHAMVEVTDETIRFTDRYHLEEAPAKPRNKTLLARMAASITNYCSLIRPVPASKERTYLARERNMLAAQRTIAAGHRTLYARARTGLSFLRTGISFMGLGFAMNKVLGSGPYSYLDFVLVGAGFLMTLDGALWYLPARAVKYGIGRAAAE